MADWDQADDARPLRVGRAGGVTSSDGHTPEGIWVEIHQFRGEPRSEPWCWWWDGKRMHCDYVILDNDDGVIDGKGMCGVDYQTHVMRMPRGHVPAPPGSVPCRVETNNGAGVPDLAWTRDAHGWIAPCGSEGQGEARCLPFRGGWAWMLDMLPGTDEPTIVAQDVFVRLEDAQAEAARQVAAWPTLIDGARRV